MPSDHFWWLEPVFSNALMALDTVATDIGSVLILECNHNRKDFFPLNL